MSKRKRKPKPDPIQRIERLREATDEARARLRQAERDGYPITLLLVRQAFWKAREADYLKAYQAFHGHVHDVDEEPNP